MMQVWYIDKTENDLPTSQGKEAAVEKLTELVLLGSKALLPLLALWLLLRCVRSMLQESYEPELWAHLELSDGTALPVTH